MKQIAKCECGNNLFIIKGKEVKMIKAYFICKECGKKINLKPEEIKEIKIWKPKRK